MLSKANYVYIIFLLGIVTLIGAFAKNMNSDLFNSSIYKKSSMHLGIERPDSALQVLYHSGTLTKQTIWANIKRVGVVNDNELFSHIARTLKELDIDQDFTNASYNLFGQEIGVLGSLLGKKPLLSERQALLLIIAQTQELFGRKEGQERSEAFGYLDEAKESKEDLKIALSSLGMLDKKDPRGDEEIIIMPGSALRGVLGKLAYIESLRRNKKINPKKVIISTGDRDLSESLDGSLNLYQVDDVKRMLDKNQPFSDIEYLLAKNYSRANFSDLVGEINKLYDEGGEDFVRLIKKYDDNKRPFNPISETGGAIYLLYKLGLDNDIYEVLHSGKYPSGKRPDTDSTAITLKKYFDEKAIDAKTKIGIAAFQPYLKRQTYIFEKHLDNKNISGFGPKYNFWEAKRAMSEFSSYVYERSKKIFDKKEIEHLGYNYPERGGINIGDMPSID